jgi:phosphate/sulfate permease
MDSAIDHGVETCQSVRRSIETQPITMETFRSVLVALVLAAALWLTLGTLIRAAASVKSSTTHDTGSWGFPMCLAWGCFYLLTH